MPKNPGKAIDATAVQAAVFDMGGVILEGGPSDVRAFGARVGLSEEIWAELRGRIFANDGPWSAVERGEIPLQAFVEHLRDEILEAGGAVDAELAARFMGDRTPDAQARRIRHEIVTSIAALRRVMPTALLTNNVAEWRAGWKQLLDVDTLFDVVIDSSEVGARKPETRIYEITRERLGVPHQGIFFLDDIGQNLKEARRLGWQTVLYTDTRNVLDVLGAILESR